MNTSLNKKMSIAILSGFLTCSIFAQESVKTESSHNHQSYNVHIASDLNKMVDPKDLK